MGRSVLVRKKTKFFPDISCRLFNTSSVEGRDNRMRGMREIQERREREEDHMTRNLISRESGEEEPNQGGAGADFTIK